MAFTQLPEPMPPRRVARDRRRVAGPERIERRCEVVGRIGLVRAHLDQQVHRAARREWRRDRGVAHDELEPVIGEQLERRQRAELATEPSGGGHRIGSAVEADHPDRSPRQTRHEPQPDPRQDRQGPLAAREQPGEVVAGVVLRHAGEAPQHGPVGEHRLEAADLPAHRSVAEDVDAAGVRRDHPADRRRVARAEVDAHLPAGRPRRRLRRDERHAGTDGHLAAIGVHVLDAVQAPQADHDLPAARHRPADEPGVAALGHDPDAGIGACAEHAGDLLGRRRAHDRERGPGPAAGPVGLVRGPQIGVRQAVAGPDDLGELSNERGRVHALMLPARNLLARRAWTNATSGFPCPQRTRATSSRTRRRA